MQQQDDFYRLVNDLYTLEEHIAQRHKHCADLQTYFAKSRSETYQDRLARWQDKKRQLEVFEQTPPAMSASEDRLRKNSLSLRPLTVAEQQVLSLRGSWLFRLFMIVFVSRLFPSLVRNRTARIKELRRLIQREWEQRITLLHRELNALERDLYEQKNTAYQQYVEKEFSTNQKEIRDLTLKRDLLEKKIKEHEFAQYFQEELFKMPGQAFLPKTN